MDKVIAVAVHDRQKQQKLGKGKSDRVFGTMENMHDKIRNRQSEPFIEHMEHGHIHQRNPEQERADQPLLHFLPRLLHGFLQRISGGCSFVCAGRGSCRQGEGRSAVACLFHGGYNILRFQYGFIEGCLHAAGEQIDFAGMDAVQSGNAFFHPGRAGGAGHTCHRKFFFDHMVDTSWLRFTQMILG